MHVPFSPCSVHQFLQIFSNIELYILHFHLFVPYIFISLPSFLSLSPPSFLLHLPSLSKINIKALVYFLLHLRMYRFIKQFLYCWSFRLCPFFCYNSDMIDILEHKWNFFSIYIAYQFIEVLIIFRLCVTNMFSSIYFNYCSCLWYLLPY